jgi:cysteine desulfurase/selenocysteine lyase
LQERVNGRPLVWLDNAATTQKPQSVIDRLNYFYEHENSNVHRAAHELAARATDALRRRPRKSSPLPECRLERSRDRIRARRHRRNQPDRAKLGPAEHPKDDEIVITWLEHHANIVPWQLLCAEKGARLRVAPVDDTGRCFSTSTSGFFGPRTRLVAFRPGLQRLGTVTPAQRMIEMAHRYGAKVVVDGAQAVSHMPVDVQVSIATSTSSPGTRSSRPPESARLWQGGRPRDACRRGRAAAT